MLRLGSPLPPSPFEAVLSPATFFALKCLKRRKFTTQSFHLSTPLTVPTPLCNTKNARKRTK